MREAHWRPSEVVLEVCFFKSAFFEMSATKSLLLLFRESPKQDLNDCAGVLQWLKQADIYSRGLRHSADPFWKWHMIFLRERFPEWCLQSFSARSHTSQQPFKGFSRVFEVALTVLGVSLGPHEGRFGAFHEQPGSSMVKIWVTDLLQS